jgi:tetratricopeptide (TPR) repeat protein
MDCRKSLLAALTVLAGSLGCLGGKPLLAPGEGPETAGPTLPKKAPQASTCIAFGDFKSKEAADPHVPEELRGPMREQARAAYEQALLINPNSVPAYVGLARLLSMQGDMEHALGLYEKALKVNPNEALVWYEMGMCHTRLKEWEPARAHLDKALSLDPQNRQYATTLGFCLARMGQYEESLALFIRLVGQAEADYKVARMAHHLKQDDVCIELLHRALQEKPDFAPARRMLNQLEGSLPASPSAAMQVNCAKEEEGTNPGNMGK